MQNQYTNTSSTSNNNSTFPIYQPIQYIYTDPNNPQLHIPYQYLFTNRVTPYQTIPTIFPVSQASQIIGTTPQLIGQTPIITYAPQQVGIPTAPHPQVSQIQSSSLIHPQGHSQLHTQIHPPVLTHSNSQFFQPNFPNDEENPQHYGEKYEYQLSVPNSNCDPIDNSKEFNHSIEPLKRSKSDYDENSNNYPSLNTFPEDNHSNRKKSNASSFDFSDSNSECSINTTYKDDIFPLDKSYSYDFQYSLQRFDETHISSENSNSKGYLSPNSEMHTTSQSGTSSPLISSSINIDKSPQILQSFSKPLQNDVTINHETNGVEKTINSENKILENSPGSPSIESTTSVELVSPPVEPQEINKVATDCDKPQEEIIMDSTLNDLTIPKKKNGNRIKSLKSKIEQLENSSIGQIGIGCFHELEYFHSSTTNRQFNPTLCCIICASPTNWYCKKCSISAHSYYHSLCVPFSDLNKTIKPCYFIHTKNQPQKENN